MDLKCEYDHVVVGAGIQGSWTAYHLAKTGCKVLLVEQFPLPHSRGSSHGQTRLIKKAYPEDYHAALMESSYEQWRHLEAEAGKQLLIPTGLLIVAPKSSTHVMEGVMASLTKFSTTEFKRLTPTELKASYPQLNFSDDYSACFDTAGGVLRADRCLKSVQECFVKAGGELWDISPVTSVESLGNTARVTVSREGKPRSVTCLSVVLCPGPWAGDLLSSVGLSLPLTPTRVSVYYWKKKDANSHPNTSFMDMDETFECYFLPELEYPGLVKFCKHEGAPTSVENPDHALAPHGMEDLERYVKEHFPGLEPKPAVIEKCMYTVTPDATAIMDVHPKYHNIVVGCGYSGHGFKLSPAVGEILAALAQQKKPTLDISAYSLKRFVDK